MCSAPLHTSSSSSPPLNTNNTMALAQVSASLTISIRDVCVIAAPNKTCSTFLLPLQGFATKASAFTGSPLLISRSSYNQKRLSQRQSSMSIRCEQNSQGGGSTVDVWLGRLAMVGFAVAITVEVSTGKGLLENFGLTSPLPIVALGVTALVGILTAIFILQSASKS